MFRIGVVSDTHHKWKKALKALQSLGRLDLVCHGGDMVADGIKLGQSLGVDLKGVSGNCDYEIGTPDELIFEIEQKNIYLVHGHKYRVKRDYQTIIYRAIEVKADVVIFGHTHVPASFKHQHIVFLNPGSITIPRGNSNASFGLIEITEEKVETKIFQDFKIALD